MYWNWRNVWPWQTGWGINRNMRCIEIGKPQEIQRAEWWLIETWDVLKFLTGWCSWNGMPINRNMRCIEMAAGRMESKRIMKINRNMRCIEIQQPLHSGCSAPRLIETWDVLKWQRNARNDFGCKINRNMRCIEINLQFILYHRLKD